MERWRAFSRSGLSARERTLLAKIGVLLTSATTPPSVMYCPLEAPIAGRFETEPAVVGPMLEARGLISLVTTSGILGRTPVLVSRAAGAAGRIGWPRTLLTVLASSFPGTWTAGVALSPG